MKFEAGKATFTAILTILVLFVGLFSTSFSVSRADDICGTDTYDFTSDGSNAKVNVDFSTNSQEITVTALNGWTVNNLSLDQTGGSISFVSFGSGDKANYDPAGIGNIGTARVEMYKVCPSATATATSTPVVTQSPSPSPTEEGKIDWCHTEPNGNSQTLNLPISALTNAGHMAANGSPLHAGDYLGACIIASSTPTATATATSTPSATPVASATPTATPSQCEGDCPTSTPTSTPNGDVCTNVDGIQTGLPGSDWYFVSEGSTICRQFQYGGPNGSTGSTGGSVLGASTQGQVLGASTMAGTGSFAETIYQAIMGLGGLLTFKGVKKLKISKKK